MARRATSHHLTLLLLFTDVLVLFLFGGFCGQNKRSSSSNLRGFGDYFSTKTPSFQILLCFLLPFSPLSIIHLSFGDFLQQLLLQKPWGPFLLLSILLCSFFPSNKLPKTSPFPTCFFASSCFFETTFFGPASGLQQNGVFYTCFQNCQKLVFWGLPILTILKCIP